MTPKACPDPAELAAASCPHLSSALHLVGIQYLLERINVNERVWS